MSKIESVNGGILETGGGPFSSVGMGSYGAAGMVPTVVSGNSFDIKMAVRQILEEDPYVADIAPNRIFPGFCPTKVAYPAVAFRRVGMERSRILTPQTSGLWLSRFVVYSIADGSQGYAQSAKLALAVSRCLDGYRGLVLSATLANQSLMIKGIFFEDDQDDFDPETKTFQSMSIFNVWHNQSSTQ